MYTFRHLCLCVEWLYTRLRVPYLETYIFLVGYKQYSEAKYFADQSGVFEIAPSKDPTHGNAMIQV